MTIPLSLCKESPGKASGEFREKADASGGQLRSRRTRTSARVAPTRMLPTVRSQLTASGSRPHRRGDPARPVPPGLRPAPSSAPRPLRAPEHQEPTRRSAPFPNANDPGPCQLRPQGQSPAPATPHSAIVGELEEGQPRGGDSRARPLRGHRNHRTPHGQAAASDNPPGAEKRGAGAGWEARGGPQGRGTGAES